MIPWNALVDPEPVVPKCPECFRPGRGGEGYHWGTDFKEPCCACSATGLAQPPVCGECGGSGDARVEVVADPRLAFPGELGVYATKCPACSGTGRAPWDVLVTVDVFGEVDCPECGGSGEPVADADVMQALEGTYHKWGCESCHATGHVLPFEDDDLATLFATIAQHPEMRFHLLIKTVASAERAEKFLKARRNVAPGQKYPSTNLTLLAVAHDQPSLDALLPAVLAIPGMHGVWLKGLDGAVDNLCLSDCTGRCSHEDCEDALDHCDNFSILLLDEVVLNKRDRSVYCAKRKRWANTAAAQAREAGVRVVTL